MRIPEAVFPAINRIVRWILNSPAHALMSDSFAVLNFNGVKSGAPRYVPLRYSERDGAIQCFTTKDTGWWPNFRAPMPVHILIRRQWRSGRASALMNGEEAIFDALKRFLSEHPGDAEYYGLNAVDGRVDDDAIRNRIADVVSLRIEFVNDDAG